MHSIPTLFTVYKRESEQTKCTIIGGASLVAILYSSRVPVAYLT